MTRYEQDLIARSVAGWTPLGDPYRAPPNGFAHVVLPRRKVEVVRAGWFGPHGKPVYLGERFDLPLDEARGAVALGRAELV